MYADKCTRKDIFEIEKILEVSGDTGSPKRHFKVWWVGYGADYDTWEPFYNLFPNMIKEYLLANNLYDHVWSGARCTLCDKPCKSSRGVKFHIHHCYFFNADLLPIKSPHYYDTIENFKIITITDFDNFDISIKIHHRNLKKISVFSKTWN